MNRPILRLTVIILLCVGIFASCKKTNPLHNYPNNYRILSYNELTTTNPPGFDEFYYQNYKFEYDGYNRVTKVYYTSNNPTFPNTISYLTYSNDTIYDTTRLLNYSVVEVDTFVTDLHGMITTTHILGQQTQYAYLGKLLTRVTYNDTTYNTITSYYGNFLKLTPSLTRNFLEQTDYDFYTSSDMYNRPGDYLQIGSFTRYGFNFYQNNNLIHHIKGLLWTTTASYVFDADSKIIQTTAVTTDTANAEISRSVYNFQYERY